MTLSLQSPRAKTQSIVESTPPAQVRRTLKPSLGWPVGPVQPAPEEIASRQSFPCALLLVLHGLIHRLADLKDRVQDSR